jgi:nitrite reductase/ring-hydroxylating ferredoxin subunit
MLRIAAISDLTRGKSIKFQFKRDGITFEGFLANFQGALVAYENVCRHLPLSLDYGDGRFFTEDGKHFICQTHGAMYEPLTGLCVEGPCQGASLKPLEIEIQKGEVWLVED